MIFQPSQARVRLLLCLPFIALAVTALILVAVSSAAWGAAREVRYPDALPTIGGLIFAMPSLVFSGFALRSVWHRTQAPFRIAPRRMLLGLLPVVMASGLLLAYVVVIGDPEWYRGEFDEAKSRWNPLFEQRAFILVTTIIAVAVPMGVFGLLVWWLYCRGIAVVGLSAPEGLDPMGEIARTGGAFPTR